jgi:type I restriction enzyme S subunit
MSFPRYEEYKDSGVDLMGEVPRHWSIWKLAHAFTQIGSGTTPKSDNAEYYEDGTIPWVNTGDLNDGPLSDCNKCITEKAAKEHSSLKLYPAGSLLFAMYGATIGKLGLLKFPATVNQACCVFSGDSPITIHFLFYWFLGLRQKVLSLATGGGQPNVSQDILRALRVACPNKNEQRAIASFLDRETSKIDALVSEQRRLVELLKEKRQAVISHAVNKGLDPSVPMKPSGIEWLGDVPAHWGISVCRHYVSILSGFAFPSAGFSENESHVRLLRGINVGVSEIRWDETVYWARCDDDGLTPFELQEGDLVIGMDRPWITAGVRVAKIGRDDVPSLLLQRVARIKPDHRLSTDYLFHFLTTPMFTGYFEPETTGVSVPHISPTQILNFTIAIPPIDEQFLIAVHLHQSCDKFDALIAEADRAIALLQERRTALISAAVTGKINIRGFTSKGAEA